MKTKTRTVKPIIGFRPGPLAPLIAIWLERNPALTTSELFRRGLMRELRPLAGRKFKHLFQ
jgi:hypothetical protein